MFKAGVKGRSAGLQALAEQGHLLIQEGHKQMREERQGDQAIALSSVFHPCLSRHCLQFCPLRSVQKAMSG